MRARRSPLAVGLFFLAAASAGCLGIAGIADFRVGDDPLPVEAGPSQDATASDAPAPTDASGDRSVADATADAEPIDAETDGGVPDADAAPFDAADGADAADAADGADGADAAPPSAGLSDLEIPGTGVFVGAVTTVVLTARNEVGDPIARTGARVVLSAAGGSSTVSFGAVADLGDGRYRATVTGVAAGTKLDVTATIDGAALRTPPRPLRVVVPIARGLTLHVDAANADGAGTFGGKGCPAAGSATLADLSGRGHTGTLVGFAAPCGVGSGWAGTGTPQDPERIAFDGQDDHVAFGAVNALASHTVLAWVRRTGPGTFGTTGTGGLPQVWPFFAKGTDEAESAALDIGYFLGFDAAGHLATDYERAPTSDNVPLVGPTIVRDDAWAFVATTLDAAAGVRETWLNGVVDATLAPIAGPGAASSSVLVLGGANRSDGTASGRFKGDVAVVLTYDRALAGAEVVALCHGYSTRFGFGACPP